MDPVNILILLNLFVSTSANWGGARKGLKTSITKVIDRPNTYLQKLPPNISALVLVLLIMGIFSIGTLSANSFENMMPVRITGLFLYITFSWIQVWAYKSLGKSYAQDIVILKDHELQTKGLYKFIRHPQYLSQLLSDLGVGLALLSYLIIPIVIFVELPLFVLRANEEEKILHKHFKDEYNIYKKRSGFMLPFIG
jgi:protein-S-isoprenylcysteine O-methyltransferase Ste14